MEFELRTKFSMILSLLLLFLLIFSFRCSDDNPTGPMDAAKFEIRADDLSIYSGGRMQLNAILTNSDGSTTDVTPQTLWSNSPALVGTIDGNGLFTAINNVIGIETIRAEYGSEVTTVDVEVTRRAGFLGVSPVLASVQSGNDLQFMAAVTFQDGSEGLATDKVAWSVSPGVAASIEGNGLLKTIPGMTGIETVQASYHGLIANSEVEIQLQHPSRFDMVEIPAGVFEMGDDNGLDDEKPAHEVFVSAFEIGRYEVTNAEYARYLTEAFARGEIRHEHGFISKGKPPFLFVGLSKIDAPEFGEQSLFLFLVVWWTRVGLKRWPDMKIGQWPVCTGLALRLSVISTGCACPQKQNGRKPAAVGCNWSMAQKTAPLVVISLTWLVQVEKIYLKPMHRWVRFRQILLGSMI